MQPKSNKRDKRVVVYVSESEKQQLIDLYKKSYESSLSAFIFRFLFNNLFKK